MNLLIKNNKKWEMEYLVLFHVFLFITILGCSHVVRSDIHFDPEKSTRKVNLYLTYSTYLQEENSESTHLVEELHQWKKN